MKKIAFITSELNGIGGAATVVKNLTKALKVNYDIYFIGQNNESMMVEGCKVIYYNHNNFNTKSVLSILSKLIRGINRYTPFLNNQIGASIISKVTFTRYKRETLRKIIEVEKIDVVIAVAGANAMLLGSIAQCLNNVTCIGWQLNSYEAYFETRNKYLWNQDNLFKKCIPNLDYYIVLNEHDQILLYENLQINSSVIYNPKTHISSNKALLKHNVMVAAGHLWVGKGFDLLIESSCIFFQNHSDWEIHIYGVGPMHDRLLKKIKQLRLDKNILLLGNTNHLFDKLINSSVFLLPSRWEGMPMVILDALEAGVPVISFDIPAIEPLIKNNKEGIIVEKYNVIDYGKAMISLADNFYLRRSMGDFAAVKANSFNVERIITQWCKLW